MPNLGSGDYLVDAEADFVRPEESDFFGTHASGVLERIESRPVKARRRRAYRYKLFSRLDFFFKPFSGLVQ